MSTRRVILIGAHPGPDTMERHIACTFRDLGWRVMHFDCRRIVGFSPRLNAVANSLLRLSIREPERLRERVLLHRIEDFQPNFILVLLGNQLSPKTVAAIRARFDIPIVVWCQDQMTTMDRQYLIGAEYDYVFVKDHYMVEFLREMAGIRNVHYLPEACNPKVHRTVELTDSDWEKYSADVMTYGSLYYYRQSILTALKGFNLKIWGTKPDWLLDRLPGCHMGKGVFETEKCKAVRAARIALNTLHYGEIRGLNARAFEIAGIGGFQLMSYSPIVHEHFVVGKEIETFSSRSELVEKVEYYLRQPEKRREIAAAAQRRAYAEHTYTHRLSELLRIIGVL